MSRPFQVDLTGVIELLSRHIYSSPRVYLRELIQNGVDAIRAAEKATQAGEALAEPLSAPQLTITPAGNSLPFTFQDNGIGLTANEAAELLATVGRSSKRDAEFGFKRDDYLGQFGIGLLSCFMVSQDIEINSKSRKLAADGQPAPAITWIGHIDGTFTITELSEQDSEAVPYGTTVTLKSRYEDEDLLAAAAVTELARTFAEFLPVPVNVVTLEKTERIGRPAPFLPPARDSYAQVHAYGTDLIGSEPLAAIPLDIPSTSTHGVAYVLPYAPPPGAAATARIYLSRMMLAERVPDVVPAWASFAHVVLSTDHLTPTASREQLITNDALRETTEALGKAITTWVEQQAEFAPETLAEFVSVHHIALRQMAAHYDDLAEVLIPMLPVETSAGHMSIGEYLETTRDVRYARTVDEFRQVSSIVSPNRPVINAGYSFVEELLLKLTSINKDISVQHIEVAQELTNLSPVPFDDASRAAHLEKRATTALDNKYLQVIVRNYEPDNLPALYVADPDVIGWIERDRARSQASGPWGDILASTQDVFDQLGTATKAQLCLNWSNRAVRSLAALNDSIVFARSIRLIYAQAKLSGHHPLTAADRTMLTESLDDLITLSIGLPDLDFPEL